MEVYKTGLTTAEPANAGLVVCDAQRGPSCQTCIHAYPHIEAASCQFDKCECIYHYHIVNCRLLNEHKKEQSV